MGKGMLKQSSRFESLTKTRLLGLNNGARDGRPPAWCRRRGESHSLHFSLVTWHALLGFSQKAHRKPKLTSGGQILIRAKGKALIRS